MASVQKTKEVLFSKDLHALSIKFLQTFFSSNQITNFQLKSFFNFYQENKELEEIEEE